MESYSQPWTVLNKTDKFESEYYPSTISQQQQQQQMEKPQYLQQWEKPQYLQQWEKPQYLLNHQQQNEKPEIYSKQLEGIYGEWEKICKNLEQMNMEKQNQHHHQQQRQQEQQISKKQWGCEGKQCCDEEMVNLIKNMIHALIGAEQSYIQLGFLCMDEKFTLTNTAEYFRLCGLRMRWLANGLIVRSVRLFNVNEWINNTTFENFFKVPSKEEMATNNYTNIIKTFFKISMEAELNLVEKMHHLGQKLMKVDWINTECRFEGFKWFMNFVLPYQMHFVRMVKEHYNNINMCDNGYIFDKCEMLPLVQRVEEFIHQLVRGNTCMIQKKEIILSQKQW